MTLNTHKGIRILTWQDAAYPNRLRTIDDAPVVLYCKGTVPDIDEEPVIAMVGTRKASAYGLMQAKQLGFQLGKMGAIVTSGGADGIDTMCLKGALSAGNPVIAVLGCGVDVVYPAFNRHLFEDICANGCLISEYPPGTPALGAHFPVRNRILSAISLGVVVVEAPKKSGALITANHALEQGRDVFTLPANIGTQTCTGNIQLLKDGAIVVEEGWDVMREYEHLFPGKIRSNTRPIAMSFTRQEREFVHGGSKKIVAEQTLVPSEDDTKAVDKAAQRSYIDVHKILGELTEDEKTVVLLLEKGEMHIDEIIAASSLAAGRVLASLTLLEVKGYITRLPARRFSLAEK
ncbi:MAG: DNA-processing protein DprA [Oscillospiraceae bacterium]|nr:DNA-processing protein DprA [Oscillospiraceae bacterium]